MILMQADLGHLWQHLEAKTCPPTWHEYRLLVGEVLNGRAFAGLDDAGFPLALGGVFDAGDGGPGYPWLSVVPGGLGARLVPAWRHMRRVIGWAVGDYPQGLACCVDDDNGRGQRLARALGFRPGAGDIAGLRRWDLAANGGCSERTDGATAASLGPGGAGRATPPAG